MECEHSFAIPVNCDALDRLIAMPCVGFMGPTKVAFTPQRGQYAPTSYILPRLLKAAVPIVSCTKYFVVEVVWFLNVNQAATYYFAKCLFGKFTPQTAAIGAGWTADLGKRECFFLGKFPVYWSKLSRTWFYAHLYQPGPSWPFGHAGFMPNVNMRIFKELPPDRWGEYALQAEIQDYKRQLEYWAGWIEWRRHCLGVSYPPETSTLPRWPGKPISSLILPKPETPAPVPPAELPAAPGAPAPLKTPLKVSFSEVLDALILELEL